MIQTFLYAGYRPAPDASELISIWLPERPSGVPLILCHGFLGSATQWFDPSVTETIAPASADAGAVAFGPSLGQNHWGNNDFLEAFDDALDYAAAHYSIDTTEVALLMLSMGGMALNWIWRNPTRVRAFAGIIPSVNLEGIWRQNPIGLASFIELAYTDQAGLFAALGTHDPSTPGPIAAITPVASRGRLYYSTNDNVIDPNHVLRYSALTGIEAVSIGAVGHSIGGATSTVLSWLLPRITRAGTNSLTVVGNMTISGNVASS